MKIKSSTIVSIITFFLSFLLLIAPILVFAQIKNPLKFDSITEFIADVLKSVVKVGGVIAVFAFIWSGFVFVQAQGNTTKLETARTVFTNTCIGVALLVGAQLIATIITGTITNLGA